MQNTLGRFLVAAQFQKTLQLQLQQVRLTDQRASIHIPAADHIGNRGPQRLFIFGDKVPHLHIPELALDARCHVPARGRYLVLHPPGTVRRRPREHLLLRIADEPIAEWSDDLRIADGEIGEIVVKGPQVTASYFNRADSNALAKIADPQKDGFYHRMGDLGYRDDQGRIWFCGRKAHRVVTAAETLFTIPCEAVFNTHPEVFRTALVGVGAPGRQHAVLCVELETGVDTAAVQRINRELLAIGAECELTRNIKRLLFHPAFPVDIRHNAKIFREQLAEWAAEKTS